MRNRRIFSKIKRNKNKKKEKRKKREKDKKKKGRNTSEASMRWPRSRLAGCKWGRDMWNTWVGDGGWLFGRRGRRRRKEEKCYFGKEYIDG